ncbi:MAG: hypothetical protein LQ345_001664 [Seirophora villosa]|nr:MAG: hypothetical protein LQ345_001664 [Seirophora villosa]
MPNEHYGDLLGRLSSACTFPTADEFDDTTCHICLRDSLATHKVETPTKLICGHVFGMGCLLKWASNCIVQEIALTCPICRTVFLTRNERSSQQQSETNELLHLFSDLTVREAGDLTLSDREETWISTAQDYWGLFCNELVDSLETLFTPLLRSLADDTSSSRSQEVLTLVSHFHLTQTLVENFLSYESVYCFYLAHECQNEEFAHDVRLLRWWEDLHRSHNIDLEDWYGELTAHISTADRSRLRRWRVSRALDGGKAEVPRLVRKMKAHRVRFLSRVEGLRGAVVGGLSTGDESDPVTPVYV